MHKDTDFTTDKYLLQRIDGIDLASPAAPILIIQGHPRSWHGEPRLTKEIKRIVGFSTFCVL